MIEEAQQEAAITLAEGIAEIGSEGFIGLATNEQAKDALDAFTVTNEGQQVSHLRLVTMDAEPAPPLEGPQGEPIKHSFRRNDEAGHGWICRACGATEEDPVAVHERKDCHPTADAS